MDYSLLEKTSFGELKKMAKDMGLESKRSKTEYITSIQKAFQEYEQYKKKKVDKYIRVRQLGNKGKEGICYLVKDNKDKEFAMKTFRKTKSSNTLKTEYILQKKAASVGISPRVVEYDSVSKYIVMEKMDQHLLDVMKKQNGSLTKSQQVQIIEIYEKLDEIKVFHGDSNLLNYMLKGKKIYIIDFGFSKEINQKFIKKLGTDNPNLKIMTLGFILKLKDLKYPPKSWKYLKKYISDENIKKFGI
jgi:tRNA A-37 threonylcarbamoyl transferase component Bud32